MARTSPNARRRGSAVGGARCRMWWRACIAGGAHRAGGAPPGVHSTYSGKFFRVSLKYSNDSFEHCPGQTAFILQNQNIQHVSCCSAA